MTTHAGRRDDEFRNGTLAELPHPAHWCRPIAADRDYATTIARNFLVQRADGAAVERLRSPPTPALAADRRQVAEGGALPPAPRARDWLVRLGDGTDESQRRAQAALDHLMCLHRRVLDRPPGALKNAGARNGAGVETDKGGAARLWRPVDDALGEATLVTLPSATGSTVSKAACIPEHLGYLLAEMQAWPRPPGRHPVVNAAAPVPSNWRRAGGAVWAASEPLTDRRSPVVTPAELGILRDVREGGRAEVVITPTYSGCPAMGSRSRTTRALSAQGPDAG